MTCLPVSTGPRSNPSNPGAFAARPAPQWMRMNCKWRSMSSSIDDLGEDVHRVALARPLGC
eukprot:14706000-Alexandrium_andersonii.AAC.1